MLWSSHILDRLEQRTWLGPWPWTKPTCHDHLIFYWIYSIYARYSVRSTYSSLAFLIKWCIYIYIYCILIYTECTKSTKVRFRASSFLRLRCSSACSNIGKGMERLWTSKSTSEFQWLHFDHHDKTSFNWLSTGYGLGIVCTCVGGRAFRCEQGLRRRLRLWCRFSFPGKLCIGARICKRKFCQAPNSDVCFGQSVFLRQDQVLRNLLCLSLCACDGGSYLYIEEYETCSDDQWYVEAHSVILYK